MQKEGGRREKDGERREKGGGRREKGEGEGRKGGGREGRKGGGRREKGTPIPLLSFLFSLLSHVCLFFFLYFNIFTYLFMYY